MSKTVGSLRGTTASCSPSSTRTHLARPDEIARSRSMSPGTPCSSRPMMEPSHRSEERPSGTQMRQLCAMGRPHAARSAASSSEFSMCTALENSQTDSHQLGRVPMLSSCRRYRHWLRNTMSIQHPTSARVYWSVPSATHLTPSSIPWSYWPKCNGRTDRACTAGGVPHRHLRLLPLAIMTPCRVCPSLSGRVFLSEFPPWLKQKKGLRTHRSLTTLT